MDANSCPPNERIGPIPVAQEIALRERLRNTNEKLETLIAMAHARMSRFPHRLRGIGGADNRYMVPSVVAIGPYHHGLPHLQQMEEVKHAAAHRFCGGSGRSVEEVYKKILSIAGDARRSYDDASPPVAGLSDAEFADMMFVDACFLLWYLNPRRRGEDEDQLRRGCRFSYRSSNIYKDILRLENQIPLLVLEALMTDDSPVDLLERIQLEPAATAGFFNREEENQEVIIRSPCIVTRFLMACCRRRVPEEQSQTDTVTVERSSSTISIADSKPPHLLGLVRSSMISGMPRQKTSVSISGPSSLLSRSAVDLAQIGVKLAASRAHWFADMKVRKKPICGELSVSSLSLDDFGACCLVNMAALEMAETLDASSAAQTDAYVVSSYLSLLAMLMDREEDVHELRMRGVLRSSFSNAQTLAFFKELSQHLRPGYNYYRTLAEIGNYMSQRWAWIAVHKFVYNYHRIIVAVLSIAGVLVSILKALYSLKKP
ncbi:unnamed protein product [Urochloa decumbens]|uniref:Uncharacterized protein n=1 Tax=Urochloa decumbens TaxID=240449 RepID=A0ABC9B8B7_9POAL